LRPVDERNSADESKVLGIGAVQFRLRAAAKGPVADILDHSHYGEPALRVLGIRGS